MKNKIIYTIPVLLSLLAACTKDANIKMPDVPSKLAVFSFISPGDTFYYVKVESTTPLYQGKINPNQDLTVKNATVQIQHNGASLNLVYDQSRGLYTAPTVSLPVTEGGKYTLIVEDQQGRKVKAETTVPQRADIKGRLEADSSAGGDTYSTTFTWQDPVGEGNFYRLLVIKKDSFLVNPDSNIFEVYETTIADDYLTDKGKDGNNFSKFIPNKDGFSSNPVYMHPRNLRFSMMLCSREYYLYHQSVIGQLSGGGPFSEPVQNFTNMQPHNGAKDGGVGCFGAYIQQEYHF